MAHSIARCIISGVVCLGCFDVSVLPFPSPILFAPHYRSRAMALGDPLGPRASGQRGREGKARRISCETSGVLLLLLLLLLLLPPTRLQPLSPRC